MQHCFLATDDQGVPGIVTALKTNHTLGMIGQPINNLALALITPLGSNHHYVLGQFRSTFPAQYPLIALEYQFTIAFESMWQPGLNRTRTCNMTRLPGH